MNRDEYQCPQCGHLFTTREAFEFHPHDREVDDPEPTVQRIFGNVGPWRELYVSGQWTEGENREAWGK